MHNRGKIPLKEITVQGIKGPVRLERFLRTAFPDAGRQSIRSIINRGEVYINGRQVWLCSWSVDNGDHIKFMRLPEARPEQPGTFNDAWLIAEEDDLIVINKPAGLLSEPTHWTGRQNLLNLAAGRFGRVYLFHRLDRDTSGIVLLTRGGRINQYLDHLFKTGRTEKSYIAVVPFPNALESEGIIDAPIAPHQRRHDMMTVVSKGGKHAVTLYKRLCEAGDKQWLLLCPKTGRTHQLRVHMAYKGAPILGDRLYNRGISILTALPCQSVITSDKLYNGSSSGVSRLMLHAHRLTLPAEGGYPLRTYSAPLPDDFLIPEDWDLG